MDTAHLSPMHYPYLLFVVLFPQVMYFMIFCVIFWKWHCGSHHFLSQLYIPNSILFFILTALSVFVIVLLCVYCVGILHITIIIWCSILLFITFILTFYSFISGKSSFKLHQLFESRPKLEWQTINELFLTILFLFFYFVFQFILSLNFTFSDMSSNESEITNYSILYISSHLFALFCVFRDIIFTSKANIMKCLIFNVDDLKHKVNESQISETKASSELEDKRWNEYIAMEQSYLVNNIIYMKTLNDAMPKLNTNIINKHAKEQRLMLILKYWIQYYGIPALKMCNDQIYHMHRLETDLHKFHKEADDLDEETVQLTQKIFTLQNDVSNLNKRYTAKCNELDHINNNKIRIQITEAEKDMKHEVLLLKQLCHLKTEEYQQAKHTLFKKSMEFSNFSASVSTEQASIISLFDAPSIINDDDDKYSILFRINVDHISLFMDLELKNAFVGVIDNKNSLQKDRLIYGKYVNDKVVALENGFYCSATDVLQHNTKQSTLALNGKYIEKRKISRSYKDIEMEAIRGTKLADMNLVPDEEGESVSPPAQLALNDNVTSCENEGSAKEDSKQSSLQLHILWDSMKSRSNSPKHRHKNIYNKESSGDKSGNDRRMHLLSLPSIHSWSYNKHKSAKLLDKK